MDLQPPLSSGESMSNKRKKSTLSQKLGIVALGLGIVTVTIRPATAYMSDVVSISNNFLSLFGIQIPSEYTAYLNEAEQFYNAVFTGNLDGIISSANYAAGALGYPILGETTQPVQDISDQVANSSEVYIPFSQDFEKSLQSEVDYAVGKGQLELQLGEEGQSDAEKAMTTVAEATTGAIDASDRAQGYTVSQDILRELTTQNGYVATTLQAIYNNTQQAAVNDGLGNYSLVKLARNAEQQDWEESLKAVSVPNYYSTVQASGYGYGLPSSSPSPFP
jgi:hypothetical protein